MRKFLTILSILIALSVLNSLALLPSVHAKSKAIVLKAAAMAPRDMPVMKGFEEWGKEIEKLTSGKVKFEFYWGASLLKSGDALKGTGMGLADVCIDVPAYHPADTPFGTIGELGFITSQVDAPARALSDLYESVPNFRNQFDRHNLKIMFFVPFTPTILGLSNKQVKTLGDLKGNKIRALGLLNQVIAKLGGTPVAIPVPEVYESLSRGVIQGFTGFPLNGVKGFKLQEVAKYYLDFGYGNYVTEFIAFNKDKWEGLPSDVRDTIEKVNKRAIDIYTALYAKEEKKYVEPLIEAGCNFYTLPEDEMELWKNKVVPGLWNEWVEKNKRYGDSQTFFNKYMELVRKYEESSTYENPFPK